MSASAAARRLGALGASRGGQARAAKLSAERRREIAAGASRARWARERRYAILDACRKQGLSFTTLSFLGETGERLFVARSYHRRHAEQIGVIALRIYRAAGYDAVISYGAAGPTFEAVVELAQRRPITSEVCDDPA